MTTVRIRTTARKIAVKVRPGVRVKMARPIAKVTRLATPVKIRRVSVKKPAKQPARFQQDHD